MTMQNPGVQRTRRHQKHREDVMREHKSICHLCGAPGSDAIDHIVPVAWGGSDHPDNLAPAHTSCNSRKGADTPDAWTYSHPSMWEPGYGPLAGKRGPVLLWKVPGYTGPILLGFMLGGALPAMLGFSSALAFFLGIAVLTGIACTVRARTRRKLRAKNAATTAKADADRDAGLAAWNASWGTPG